MRDEKRQLRRAQIEKAAYAMLESKGYAGTSMQGIARKARASNETLYNWYGDKQGLFRALVERNAAEVKALLEADLSSDRDPLATLRQIGPRLLALLLGDRAVALNRAAAADASGELGEVIAKAGRETVLPLVQQVLDRARQNGQVAFERADVAASLFVDLLVGDMQVRRVIGRLAAPTDACCRERSEQALARLVRLLRV